MQALYQWQLTQQPAAEITQQYLEDEESAGVEEEHLAVDAAEGECRLQAGGACADDDDGAVDLAGRPGDGWLLMGLAHEADAVPSG